YERLIHELEQDPRWSDIKRFLRGGYWRNFKVKYAEIQEMYGRMLQVSRRVHDFLESADALTPARQELYRAQCNCAWWHGAFGGLSLPHLRNAVYQHLIAAENALPNSEMHLDGWVDVQGHDWNLDGGVEICLRNSRVSGFFSPHYGGSLYELDLHV